MLNLIKTLFTRGKIESRTAGLGAKQLDDATAAIARRNALRGRNDRAQAACNRGDYAEMRAILAELV